ncbi:MAG TPA: MOSC domain-containing protein [Chthoniobacterales bacterium]
MAVFIHHIFISSGHNFFGRHGQEPGAHDMIERSDVRVVAGSGIEGDRFFNYQDDYKGQVTFFDWDVFDDARRHFHLPNLSPSAFRRNILVSGLELPSLVGKRFMIQDILFEGTAEAAPCYWMNRVVADGAEQWLKGKGGLRARVLHSGTLRQSATPEPVTLLPHQD